MEITINYFFIDSGELIKTTKDTFTNDRDALRFLKDVEIKKMQTIADKLELGKYRVSMIMRNATSVYSKYFKDVGQYPYPAEKKPYYAFMDANNVRTEVKIRH